MTTKNSRSPKNPQPPKSVGRQLNFTTGRMTALCQQRLEPHGLSLPQWVILSCLWREGELTVSALSSLIGSGLPATSRIIDRMEEGGLITRHKDARDRRIMRVGVTAQGQALDHLANFYHDINEALFDGFTDSERDIFFDLLIRMQMNAVRALG